MNDPFDSDVETTLAEYDSTGVRASQRMSIQRIRKVANWAMPNVAGHSLRMARDSLSMARELGWPPDRQECVWYAASVHDIGKAGINPAILRKTSGLGPGEYKEVREHPVLGYRLFEGMKGELYEVCAQVALHHHERWDGKGYPGNLRGEAIPVEARLVAVADVYDCLTNDRPYRLAVEANKALEELLRCRGAQFDPAMVDLFCRIKQRMIQKETA